MAGEQMFNFAWYKACLSVCLFAAVRRGECHFNKILYLNHSQTIVEKN